MPILRFVVLALLLTGCRKKREPAPTEMEALVRYVYQHFEDEEAVAEGMDNLFVWLEGQIDTDAAKDGYALEPLGSEDLADITHPARDLAGLIGATGAARSVFGIDRQVDHIVRADQVFANPGSYNRYERTFTGDMPAFRAGEGVLGTANDVETSSLGVTINYLLLKDYRWFLGEASEGIVARSWTEQRSCNEAGSTCLEQTYSLDVFYAKGVQTWRLTAAWNEIASPFPIPEATLVTTLAIGIQNVFKNTDAFLEGGE